MNAVHFETDGPYCDQCTEKIERCVGGMPGVSIVRSSYAHGLTTVLYDADLVDAARIATAIRECGFAARPAPWYGTADVSLHSRAFPMSAR